MSIEGVTKAHLRHKTDEELKQSIELAQANAQGAHERGKRLMQQAAEAFAVSSRLYEEAGYAEGILEQRRKARTEAQAERDL
jgi:hypothetical protein